MKYPRIRFLVLLIFLTGSPLLAASRSGDISGAVVDPAGIPQMGASVMISAENVLVPASFKVSTNDHGRFLCENLLPGLYTITVTLTGFFPATERHVRVGEDRITLVKIGMGSIFASLDNLRRPPKDPVESDEWVWVLRTSSSVRPVLRWDDSDLGLPGDQISAELPKPDMPRGQVEFTSGALHPGSISNLADSPGTAVVYDQDLGSKGRLLLAGQFSYDGVSPSGGFATEWLPQGDSSSVTNLVFRETVLGMSGLTFRGLRLSHNGQIHIGSRVSLRYGSDYLMAGFEGSTAELRPRVQVAVKLPWEWQASVTVASGTWQDSADAGNALQSTLDSLDEFPTLLLRGARPVLADNFHQELAVQRTIGHNSDFEAAVFRDFSRDTAVFGQGTVDSPSYLPAFFSNAFAYDAGASHTWGTRVAYRRKLSDHSDVGVVYARSGALAPDGALTSQDLRSLLSMRSIDSVSGRVATHIPGVGTAVTTSYKWISGSIVSQQDPYGEALYGIDPYLSLTIRQPLPNRLPGHMQALADFGNLLAQGYLPVASHEGQTFLVPTCRSFRGGLTFQF